MKLEDFIYPTQAQLFNRLRKRFQGRACFVKGAFVLVRGEVPVLLVAHLNTGATCSVVKSYCA